jgi:hypothetical protein
LSLLQIRCFRRHKLEARAFAHSYIIWRTDKPPPAEKVQLPADIIGGPGIYGSCANILMNILYAGVSTALLRERLRRFCRPAFRWRGRRQGRRQALLKSPQVRGDPGDKESEVAGGTAEITRGRGRDRQFCSPDLGVQEHSWFSNMFHWQE